MWLQVFQLDFSPKVELIHTTGLLQTHSKCSSGPVGSGERSWKEHCFGRQVLTVLSWILDFVVFYFQHPILRALNWCLQKMALDSFSSCVVDLVACAALLLLAAFLF